MTKISNAVSPTEIVISRGLRVCVLVASCFFPYAYALDSNASQTAMKTKKNPMANAPLTHEGQELSPRT